MKYTARIIKNGETLKLSVKAENESQARSILRDKYNPDSIVEVTEYKRNAVSNTYKQTVYDRAWKRKGTPYIKNANGKAIMIFS